MNNDITVSTLHEVCLKENKSIISGPFGSNISSKFFVETGIPVIRGNNLTIGKEMFIDSGFVYITPEKANELNCYAIKDDLIFTAAGTLGQVGMIPSKTKFNKYVISNKQIRARINRNLVLPEYAYYWFSSPWVQKKLCNNNKGSTVPLLTLSEIKSLPIKYPQNLKKQEKVVKILSSIDEQIKRNNDMVQKLQVLTQSIYSYWFNQFEFPNEEGKPYKSSGGEMVWNEELKREIPKDWTILKLKDILRRVNVNIENGMSFPTIDLSVMPTEDISLNSLNNSDNFASNLSQMFEGNILFGSIRPYLKKCGIAPCDGAVAGTVYQFEEIRKETYNYSIITMSQNSFFEYALKKSKGTRMPVVSADDLLEYSFPYNEKVFNFFNKIPLKEIIIKANKSSKELIQLKEKLLPILINGQLI